MATARIKAKGSVKWYDPRKGYGYAAAKGSPEVFIHYGALAASIVELKAGQEIEFEIERTPRGEVAHAIKLAK